MTKVKSPKVNILIGNVNKINMGFKIIFIKPKNKASQIAVQKFATVTPLNK